LDIKYDPVNDRIDAFNIALAISGCAWIKTVLLETFWVLRSVYDFDDTVIARAIEGALGLPRVQVEDSERVKLALAAVADRFDIADALHVASTPGDARAFATLDRDLARRGKGRLSQIEVL